MNLEQLVLRSRNLPVRRLLQDEEFRRSVSPHTVLATSRSSKLIFNRPYDHQRNAEFKRNYDQSWATLINNLANWERSSSSLVLPHNDRILIAGWHFPEIPTIFAYAKQIRALLLVSQDAPWLSSLKEAGCTLNLFDAATPRQLFREMQSGRIVAAMLDHYHPNTRSEKSNLLRKTVDTPSGIFDLCSRFGYLMVFIAPRANRIEVVAQIDTTGRSASELAQQYNTWLEAEIKRDPAAWLMWQALPMG